jgi:hypothetical protein
METQVQVEQAQPQVLQEHQVLQELLVYLKPQALQAQVVLRDLQVQLELQV